MRKWLIQKLGGFTLEGATLEEKHQLLTAAVKRFFNTIGPDDLLRMNELGQWIFEGKIQTEAKKKLLIAEAKQFMESELWTILQRDIKWQANKQMFINGRSETDLIAGKLWLFVLDSIKTRLNSLESGNGNFSNK